MNNEELHRLKSDRLEAFKKDLQSLLEKYDAEISCTGHGYDGWASLHLYLNSKYDSKTFEMIHPSVEYRLPDELNYRYPL